MIRVAYDSQIFLLQERGGISRYFAALIKEFKENPSLGIEPVVLRKRFPNKVLSEMGLSDFSSYRRPRSFLLESILDQRAILRTRPDILHRTYYHPHFLRVGKSLKVVDTLHDMIPEKFSRGDNSVSAHFSKAKYVRKSDGIISVSQSTYDDARDHYGSLEPALCETIWPGVPELPLPIEPADLKLLSNSFWLYVGNRDGYKDWKLAIQAISQGLLKGGSDMLICVSSGAFTEKERQVLVDAGLEESVKHKNASDGELRWLYENTSGLLFTSQYEGFGYPPLEAISAGRMPLVAKSKVAEEIYGALFPNYFSPGDCEGLRNLMDRQSLGTDKEYARKAQLLTSTSVESMARKTSDFYKSLLIESGKN